ncbi:thiopeptide-type bacteriocin biosynthesis protein [Maribacter flavus]|uniref:Thiopeptide-type bacteriocin biosynthesis domain-containing protein n=1 Tax=Maribacter flavus TaxID=1658664 RepID=A0A5B2TVI8_9FLAO|nr:thiopeptide-type bacteriocin biosynthesis protein [Maribacter flavus]KAA2218521.1 hypothetical protein F0361_02550 [Maribacter flavus]
MVNEPRRNFCVGSEWVYYKIFTGYKTADLVLTEIIKPITEQLLQENSINKWFFIRYSNPEHHLRIRFLCSDQNVIGKVISKLYIPLNQYMGKDLIWKIQLDTYNREIERYGTETIELSENLFYYDSDTTIKFLDLIEGDEGEQLRWLFGLKSINHLLNCFNYSLEEKMNLMEILKTGFGQEFGMSRPLKKQLDDKFRVQRVRIEEFMLFTEENKLEYAPIIKLLEENEKKTRPLAKQILLILNKGSQETKLNNLMSSYIHMLMNRLFKSKNRLNEMVCYDFLFRYYTSEIARIKYND